jgi:hypothetical protein
MTTRHSSKCWKSLYMYEKDLPWVWSGLGFLIICNSWTSWQNQENLLRVLVLPLPRVGCILMTTSHSSRCWKSLYMYEDDLLWVWRWLGFSIIFNSRTPWQNQENLLRVLVLPLPRVGFILMTTSHSSRCWKSLYMYEEDLLWVWSGLGFSIICNSRTPWQNQENLLVRVLVLPLPRADIKLGLHPYDHSPQ